MTTGEGRARKPEVHAADLYFWGGSSEGVRGAGEPATLEEILDCQLKKFRAWVGRDPGPDDVLFIDLLPGFVYRRPAGPLKALTIRKMERDGEIAPEVIDAFERTGFVPNPDVDWSIYAPEDQCLWRRVFGGAYVPASAARNWFNEVEEEVMFFQGELLSTGAVARLLGNSPATIRRWADARRLPHVRTLGGHRRFLPPA